MPSVRKSVITPFTCEQMYSLVTGVEKYPQFIHACTNGRVIRKSDDGYTATLDFEFKKIRKSFTTRNVATPYSEITMTLVSGPFKSLSGCWRFTALGDRACKVEFELDYEFKSALIAAASTPLMKHISETMVNSFHEEAKRKYSQG